MKPADPMLSHPVNASTIISVAQEAFGRYAPVGAGIAVVCGGRSISFGLGRRRAGDSGRVTGNTVFPIASCTKSFTAALAAVLVHRGVLSWDTPVHTLLPTIRFNSMELTEALTIRDLLAHRTGLERVILLEYGADFSDAELLQRLHAVPSVKALRSTMTYTNIGYLAAGTALAAAAGGQWWELVESELLKPLGMAHSRAAFADLSASDDLAQPHVWRDGDWQMFDRLDRTAHAPASIIHTSSNDMVNWLQFQVNQGAGLLSQAAWKEMHTPQIARDISAAATRASFPLVDAVSHGMGWNLYGDEGEQVSRHSGEVLGYSSQMAVVPSLGIGVYVVNNSGDETFSLYLVQRLLDACRGRDRDWSQWVPAARAVETARSTPVELEAGCAERLVGHYSNEYLGDVEIARLGPALNVSFSRAPLFEFSMVPLADGSWFATMKHFGFGADREWHLEDDFMEGSLGETVSTLRLPHFGIFKRTMKGQ